jgi:hypothetical protein
MAGGLLKRAALPAHIFGKALDCFGMLWPSSHQAGLGGSRTPVDPPDGVLANSARLPALPHFDEISKNKKTFPHTRRAQNHITTF